MGPGDQLSLLADRNDVMTISAVSCPVCGVEPGRPCISPVGRTVPVHRARTRSAARPDPAAPAGPARPVNVIPVVFDRRRALMRELATARQRADRLEAVIAYLEEELSCR